MKVLKRHICFISPTSSLLIQLHIYLTYLWSFYVHTPWPALNFQTSSHKSDTPFFPFFSLREELHNHCLSSIVIYLDHLFCSLFPRFFLKRSCTTYTSFKRLKHKKKNENMALKFLKCKIILDAELLYTLDCISSVIYYSENSCLAI